MQIPFDFPSDEARIKNQEVALSLLKKIIY